jgi:hypothetical protein
LAVILASLLLIGKFVVGYNRRLRQFFGLAGKTDQLLVYLSSFPIADKGLVDRFGRKRSFGQLTLSAAEVAITSWLTTLFAADPLSKLPSNVQRLLGKHWAFRAVRVSLRPSPLTDIELEFIPMLIIGGPMFNSAAKYYQRTGLSVLRFNTVDDYADRTEWTSVEVTRGRDKGLLLKTSEELDLGAVEKIVDDEHSINVLWVGGARTNGTKAALYYLIQHWDDLLDKYGDREFAICLQCAGRQFDPEGYRYGTVEYQWPV